MSTRTASARRLASAAVVAAAAVALLAGCSFGSSGGTPSAQTSTAPTRSAAPSSISSGDVSTTPSSTPTPTPTPTLVPVGLSCDQLWTAQQVYSFNANFGVAPGYAVTSGSEASKLTALKGVSCGWMDQSSGSIIEIAVAKTDPKFVAQYSGAVAEKSNVVPTYGTPPAVTGYFNPPAGSAPGTAEVFANGYWIVVDSVEFLEPGDAAPIVAAVLQNLK